MNLLTKLRSAKIGGAKAPPQPLAGDAAMVEKKSAACSCGCAIFWSARGSTLKRCKSCDPPATRSVVGECFIANDLTGPLDRFWRNADGKTAAEPESEGNPLYRRARNSSGLYDPPLVCAPVGDMTLDEWWEKLPAWF